MSAGERAARVDALARAARDRGRDDVELLVADAALLAGMRIEAGDRHARLGDAEAAAQVVGDDAPVSTITSVVSRPGPGQRLGW